MCLQLWTFYGRSTSLMIWAVTGQVKFYDEATAWGVILGADGGLYVIRSSRRTVPPLRVGERVLFEPQLGPGGPRAAGVRRLAVADGQKQGRG